MNSPAAAEAQQQEERDPFPVSEIIYGLSILAVFVALAYASYKCKRRSPAAAAAAAVVVDRSSARRHCGGIDLATLRSCPKFRYGGGGKGGGGCAICLADYEESDALRLLPECGHVFHAECVDPWLLIHATCPVCRKSPPPAVPTAGVFPPVGACRVSPPAFRVEA